MRYLTKKEKLSKFLIHERDKRGLSQQDVADAVGASLRNYQRWESGETFPHQYSMQKLQDFFGESINEAMMPDVLEHPVQDRPLVSDQEHIIAVSPQERQDYQSSSETDEGKAGTANNKSRMSPASQRGLVFSTILLILILAAVGIGFLIHITYPPHPTVIKPGGAWISPAGKTVGDIIPFAAYAYPTHSGDPAIDHVNFTMYWQGVDPRKWIIACVAHRPVRDDLFACSANLRQLGAPTGKIIISFDVYDRQGNVNLAPNGEHTLIYSPTASGSSKWM